MFSRLREIWNSERGGPAALERYYRDERLYAELAALRAGAHDRLSTLERSLYAASSYFAA